MGGDFSYDDANNDFVWNTSDSLVVLGSAFITANDFINNGNITADTFSLSVAGDFDYTNNYLNNGNIDATTLNLQVGGDFSYDDANNSFVWNAQNNLVVFGSAFVTTDNFTNYGNISADTLTLSVAGDFDYGSEFLGNGNIDATALNLQVGGDFFYDDASNDFVWNAQNSLVVFGSAFITADDFSNYGAINVVNDFNVTAGDYFSKLRGNNQCE